MHKHRNHVVRWVAILVGILALAGIALAVVALNAQEVSTDDPVDIVFDFYRPWLDASHATTTDPYQEGLAAWPLLGKELRAKIRAAQGAGGLDPVLCQTTLPEDFALRIVHQTEALSEILVTARRSTSTEQAIVTLLAKGKGWYIDDIRCSPGEIGPEREFSFDTQGSLLKNVPEPLNAEYWHLVFAENGREGHHAPLFFGEESVCVAADGTTGTCDPSTFVEASKARVIGQMTDLGVNVTRIEFTR